MNSYINVFVHVLGTPELVSPYSNSPPRAIHSLAGDLNSTRHQTRSDWFSQPGQDGKGTTSSPSTQPLSLRQYHAITGSGLPGWLSSKESTCNAGDAGDSGLIPAQGRSPGGGHGNTLHYSCLENPMDRGAQRAIFHRVAHSQTRMSTHGSPDGLAGKESTCNAEDTGLTPGSGRSHGEGHGNSLQYSCLENPMERGTWRVTVHRLSKSQT